MSIPRLAADRNARRTNRRYFLTTVTDRIPVSNNTIRFTLSAPEFQDYTRLGPDEFFPLIIPRPGQDPPRINVDDDGDPREVILALDESVRPDIRWYTVRAHRAHLGEIDVDMVVHGDSGPASRWAMNARLGDRVGFREANAAYLAPASGHQLLVADETAVPALASILEANPDLDASVIVEIPAEGDLPAIDSDHPITVVTRGDGRPGDLAIEAATRAADQQKISYAWVCGERTTAASIRRMLVDRGIDRESIMFSGYWRLGESRG